MSLSLSCYEVASGTVGAVVRLGRHLDLQEPMQRRVREC